MLAYEPMSEQDALKERYYLLDDGEYDGVIEKCELKQSASGNQMLDLTISVFDKNGKANPVRDFLVFTPKMMWKVIHCADSAGLLKEYEEKKLSEHMLVGMNVKVLLKQQQGNVIPHDKLKGKPYGTLYPNKNVVEDYLKRTGTTASQKAPVNTASPAPFDDDIPF